MADPDRRISVSGPNGAICIHFSFPATGDGNNGGEHAFSMTLDEAQKLALLLDQYVKGEPLYTKTLIV